MSSISLIYETGDQEKETEKKAECEVLIVAVWASSVVLISRIDLDVIHFSRRRPGARIDSAQGSRRFLLRANLVLMMHEEIFKHWHFPVRERERGTEKGKKSNQLRQSCFRFDPVIQLMLIRNVIWFTVSIIFSFFHSFSFFASHPISVCMFHSAATLIWWRG